jgi:sodium-dependent dicarboxylate transporter 2/3/5
VHSGLSSWLGEQLNAVETLPLQLILVVVMFLTAILTEVASNAACVNVVIPILIALVSSTVLLLQNRLIRGNWITNRY